MLKEDDNLIKCVNKVNLKEVPFLRAHRLINLVQDKVRQDMILEMKHQDDEDREKRLQKRLEKEIVEKEFKRQQRRAFMPMHRDPPDYVAKNFENPTFLKDKTRDEKGIAPQALNFFRRAETAKLVDTVPNAKDIINNQVDLEAKARRSRKKPINIFDEQTKRLSKERKKL